VALLAESLVDEWLNRQGFFTVRGIKHGVEEIDLLAVRQTERGSLEGWHVEVQASFRPVGYISPLLKDHVPSFAKSLSSAKERPYDLLLTCVNAWVNAKFFRPSKRNAFDSAWKGISWKPHFVHGVVKSELELQLIASHGIEVIPLHQVLSGLKHAAGKLKGGAGTDLAEVVEYYNSFVLPSNTTPE
jgi:hypothetical protein